MTNHSIDINVDCLARRVEGGRLIVYLDQSKLSALTTEEDHAELLELLRRGVDSGALICPVSPSHADETARIHRGNPKLWKQVDSLADELALGIGFRSMEEIEYAEIYAAAESFEGVEGRPLWKEAFREDPNTPREDLFTELFGGKVRIRAYLEPSDDLQAEIDHARSIETDIEAAYGQLRDAGFSFEEMVHGNLEQMLSWKLGQLLAPREFAGHYYARGAALVNEADNSEQVDLSPDSALNRFMAFGTRRIQMEALVRRHPEVARRPDDFRHFAPLREMPTLAFPALFRAALAATPQRRPRASDGHDISHLTHGLSRCEIVTADGGMTQLIRDYGLAPAGCQVFAFRELDDLGAAIEDRLTARG